MLISHSEMATLSKESSYNYIFYVYTIAVAIAIKVCEVL